MLEHFLQVAQPWLTQYGYVALFVVLFLEGIGIPAPGLTFVIAAVLLASRGEMHLVPVVGLALAGALCGCQLAFLIGRSGGRRLLLRTGLLSRDQSNRLQRLFERWGPPLLVVAPFVDGTRQYCSLVAGAAQMHWHRFALFNLTGVVLWIGSWSIATDVFGHHLEPVLRVVSDTGPWFLGGGLAVLLVIVCIRLVRHARARLHGTSESGGLPGARRSGDARLRPMKHHNGKSVLLGAVSYALLAALISLPFWHSG